MERDIKIVIGLLCIVGIISIAMFYDGFAPQKQTVIIKHKWTANGRYYFSDSEGQIYMMEYWKLEPHYQDLPVARYNEIVIDKEYEIQYRNGVISQYKLSLSETLRNIRK